VTTWQQAASDVLANRYPLGASVLDLLRELKKAGHEPTIDEVLHWLRAREREGTVEHPAHREWRAADAIMHPRREEPAMGANGYYRHATLGDIGEMVVLSGKMIIALATLSTKRLDECSKQAEVIHARITARVKGPATLRYAAPFLAAGFVIAVSSKGFAGSSATALLLGGTAVLMAGCAVMTVACGWDAVDEWRREHGRNRT
jgi:hypothetical protein